MDSAQEPRHAGRGGIIRVQAAARNYTTIGGRNLRYRSRALQQRREEVPVEKVVGTITLRCLGGHCSPRARKARSDCRIMNRVNRGGCAKEGARVFRSRRGHGPGNPVPWWSGLAADDEELIAQVDKPPQLLVELAEVSALDDFPRRPFSVGRGSKTASCVCAASQCVRMLERQSHPK